MKCLGGCTSANASNIDELRSCYKRVDIGYNNGRKVPGIARSISMGERNIFTQMIPASILAHIEPMPQPLFNSYKTEEAQFVVHFAGPRKKNDLLEALREIK